LNYKRITNCRICGSKDLVPYIELPDSPLCNKLQDDKSDSELYELKVLFCNNCYLSQLSIVVDPEVLYKESYPYHSSVSNTFKKHCFDMAMSLKKYKNKTDGNIILDIASNDNCLLKEFRNAGDYIVYGVEPSNSFKPDYSTDSYKDAIPVIHSFWSETCLDHTGLRNKIDFITALNVLAHVDDLDEFMRGIVKYISEDGIFVVEVPYLPNLINNNEFDTIYHEHLSYFLLKPLKELFLNHRIPIFKVEKYPIHGGSIRIYASKSYYEQDGSVSEMIFNEESNGFYSIEKYKEFANRTLRVAADLQIIMNFIKSNNKKIMAYGASAKGISIINYLGIGKYIHSIVDDTPAKQGKITPGEKIQIVGFEYFEKEKPDYIILLAWNFAEEMMAKTKHIGSRYIVPIPVPTII